MAETFRFELVSPERLVMSDDVTQVDVPGSEGDFGVLARHAPFISTLRPGVLAVYVGGTRKREVFVRGGFAEVGPDALIVLAEQAIPVEEIDAEILAQEIRNAEEDVADAKDELSREKAERQLARLRDVVAALKAAGHG
jgi:F-type H+-transporting ATPase subunit epsilon